MRIQNTVFLPLAVAAIWITSVSNLQASVVATVDGVDAIIPLSIQAHITYCVQDGFGASKELLLKTIDDASRQWEYAANIHFEHLELQDGEPCTAGNPQIYFRVRVIPNDASAFMPGVLPERRALNIALNRLKYGFEPDLRRTVAHELGHILGFHHEEQNNPGYTDGCGKEDWTAVGPQYFGRSVAVGKRSLTPYDPYSIMGYPSDQCGTPVPKGDRYFSISDLDRAGAAALYGPGAAN